MQQRNEFNLRDDFLKLYLLFYAWSLLIIDVGLGRHLPVAPKLQMVLIVAVVFGVPCLILPLYSLSERIFERLLQWHFVFLFTLWPISGLMVMVRIGVYVLHRQRLS